MNLPFGIIETALDELPINRLTLQVRGSGDIVGTHTFPVLPESLNHLNRYLVSVTPTLAGGFVDDHGPAPGSIGLTGHFGTGIHFVDPTRPPMTGHAAGLYLERLTKASHQPDSHGLLPETYLFNWMLNRHWAVVIDSFDLAQSTARNTIWLYRMQITALYELPLASHHIDKILEAAKGQLLAEGADYLLQKAINALAT
jgi:hypothetical protein